MRCLLNNLDLTVTKDGEIFYPNGLNRPDNLNNNERIIINDVDDGDEFIVVVHAKSLSNKKQTYSLISTGCYGGVGIGSDMSASQSFANGNSDVIPKTGESVHEKESGVNTKSSAILTQLSALAVLVNASLGWIIA